jgi:uncharacterized membrane protein
MTGDGARPAPAEAAPPGWLVNAVRRVEQARWLDRPAGTGQRALAALDRRPALDAALRGAWLGHAAHPLLTDVPIGFWTSSNVLDLLGGPRARPAATGLLALGVAAAGPTVATGLAEWRLIGGTARRVGLIHAAVNGGAIVLYSASLVARARRRHRAGVALGLAGTAVASAGGYLGGHLAVARKVGSVAPAMTQG